MTVRDSSGDGRALQRKVRDYEQTIEELEERLTALEQDRCRFSAVVEQSESGFVRVGPGMEVVWSNEAFRQRCGDAATRSTLLEMCAEPVEATFAGGTGANHELGLEIEGRFRHLYVTVLPIRSDDGVAECILMVQDVSEMRVLRESEDALRVSEERFRSIFENVGAGMYTCTSYGRFLQANPGFCQLLGYTESELIQSRTVADITHPDDLEAMSRQLAEVIEGRRRVIELEQRYLRKWGEPVWCRMRAVWLQDPHDRPRYAVVLVQNISHERRTQQELRTSLEEQRQAREELRLREQQLQQAQKMEAIGRLAGGIAHDFNNLLTAISGYSGLLLRKLGPGHRLQREALEISKAADRAAGLTGQLLAFSRRQVLKPKILDLNAGIADVGKLLQRVIGEDVELVTVLSKKLWAVRADPGQIQQVLMNLVVNARDAMPEGGRITIETQNVELDTGYGDEHPDAKAGPHVMIAVTDNGCGMDAATRIKIFEPFFTTKEQGKGTGLGLATVYGIVKQSGGNILVYSEVGRGTTFKVYLPRAAGAVEAVTETPVARDPLRGTETVLLVEDDEAVRSLAREILDEAGYKVLTACDGEDALDISARHDGSIDLVLTDLVMPRMGGAELVRSLEAERPEICVLYISGYTDSAVFHQGLLERGSSFLHKPFTSDSLASRVREILDRRGEEVERSRAG